MLLPRWRAARPPPPARRRPVARPPRAAAAGPTTDAAVPDGHAGLHAELYGDGGADTAHASSVGERAYERRPEDDGTVTTDAAAWLAAREAAPPVPGVVALYDGGGRLQFVGAARDAVAAVRGARARAGGDRVAAVRALLVTDGRAMVSRAALQTTADEWLAAATDAAGGVAPPGHAGDAALFAGLTAAGRTATAQAEHDDRAAKLKRAMAHGDGGGGGGGDGGDGAARRDSDALRAAMERDDWSAVIDGQTRATVAPQAAAAAPAAPASPFGHGGAAAAAGAPPTPPPPSTTPALTVESAEAALDEVRPYLLADGGDVTVLAVVPAADAADPAAAGAVVRVALRGACSTCASAGATLAMGIQAALRKRFGDALTVERVDVDGPAAALGPGGAVTAAAVDAMLDGLRPAIAAYGGSVSVADIGGDRVCRLSYEGPPPLATGILAAVRDRFPGLADVVLE